MDPLTQSLTPQFIHTLQTLWNLSNMLNQYPNIHPVARILVFTMQEAINVNTLFFPWTPLSIQHRYLMFLNPLTMAPTQEEMEVMPTQRRRTSFTEISSFKNTALVTFLQDKDMRYIHQSLVSLLNIYFKLRSTINSYL